MVKLKASDDGTSRPRATRAQAVVSSLGSWVAIFAVLPIAIGRRDRKAGWKAGRPGLINRLGVLPLGLGAAGLVWCMGEHYRPGETVEVSLVPENLIASGPYRFSRNPMYVSEQAMLLGWVLYFGSPRVMGCSVALGGAMRYAVGREERTLIEQFGDQWKEYSAKAPRWL